MAYVIALVLFCGAGSAPARDLVNISGPGNVRKLVELGVDFVSESPRLPADAVVTLEQRRAIEQLGFQVKPVTPSCYDIPDEYHTYDETFRVFDSLQRRYPNILSLCSLGTTQWRNVPIHAVKISDNVSTEEDEPAVLYTGVTHAREPLGNEIIIYLAKYLCATYATSPEVRRWVDSTEIWLIPVVNPDGFMYMFESAQSSPWWRKNQRDNDGNGQFDSSYDGVDLNRNFNWRWTWGGDTVPSSWLYRGPAPGSEAETQAWCRLVREQRPVFGIGYHSYGGIVLYPWSFQGRTTPDDDVYTATAGRMGQLTGYSVERSCGYNMSDCWSYARFGQLDFLFETGTEFIEPAHRILGICLQNFHADTFLLNRLFYSGVWGHVTDSATGAPLVAEVQVLGRVDTTLDPRTTDSLHGRFQRVLCPATYALRFICPGYDTVTVSGVTVAADSLTRLEIRLQQLTGVAEHGTLPPEAGLRKGSLRLVGISVHPNPFTTAATIHLQSGTGAASVHDATGRLVRTLDCRPQACWDGLDAKGQPLPAGVYFVSAGRARPVRLLLLR